METSVKVRATEPPAYIWTLAMSATYPYVTSV
jgi:hypothetical protein